MTNKSKSAEAGTKTTIATASRAHPSRPAASSERLIKEIRRQTKPIFSSEQKVLIIIMKGIRGELSIAELCRKYAISTQTYYTWNKEFIEAGKKRLSGDAAREATSSDVANRLYILQDHWMGMVLPIDHTRRLQPLYCLLGTMHKHG